MRISDWSSDVCSSDLIGLYREEEGGVKVSEQVLYQARIGLPSRVPTGTYRSEEHTSELQSLMRISYAVFCLKKKKQNNNNNMNNKKNKVNTTNLKANTLYKNKKQ